jgi:hypothetical protein
MSSLIKRINRIVNEVGSLDNWMDKADYEYRGGPAKEKAQKTVPMYKSLNDAAIYQPELKRGKTEVWYYKGDYQIMADWGLGYRWLAKKGLLPRSPKELRETHIPLGSIKETNLEKAWMALQGENWSPNGEARNLIRKKGLTHTSMSVGDILKVGNSWHLVDGVGFKKLF